MRADHIASLSIAACSILAVAAPAAAAPLFQQQTAKLGSPQPCASTNEGCYSHYVLMADFSNDGALDFIFANGGGFYTPSSAAPLAAYVNDGTGNFTEVNATSFGGFSGRVRQVAAGDVDGDGDLDLYLPDSYGMQPDAFFINNGQNPALFANEGPQRLPITSRSAGARFGDLDNDGDLDLVLTYWGTMPYLSPGTAKVYLNDGAGFFMEKPAAVPQNTQNIGTGPIDVDLFDAEGDLDLDMILASRAGESLLFLNDGTGTYSDANGQFPDQPGPYVYGMDECDVDGDGDLDVWLDNGFTQRREQLLINNGQGVFTDETTLRVTGNLTADDNEVQCVDIDGDGDFDALVASLSDEERIFLNDGTGYFSAVPDAFPPVGDSTLGLDLGDTNGDGILDAVTAQGESGAYLNRFYVGIAPQPADIRPPVFRRVEALPDAPAGGDFPVRFAVSDNTTTDTGPRLREAKIEITTAMPATFPARFMGGDFFRATIHVESGQTMTYRACATDWAGNSACSSEFTFTTGGTPGTGGAGTTGMGGASTGMGGASTGMGGSGTGMGGATTAMSSATTGMGGASTNVGAGTGMPSGAGGNGNGPALGEEGGCGCTVPGSSRENGPVGLLVLVPAIAFGIAKRARRNLSRR